MRECEHAIKVDTTDPTVGKAAHLMACELGEALAGPGIPEPDHAVRACRVDERQPVVPLKPHNAPVVLADVSAAVVAQVPDLEVAIHPP